jgi:threonine dehydrogenase-like Zn-dependent dehydrogenase
MRALRYERDPVRFGAARIAGSLRPGTGARFGPLALAHVDELDLPGPDWVRLRPRLSGICGSDLATVDARSSRWFEPIVSFPFVPGHEVVADVQDGDGTDRRVVLEPVLGCVTRGIEPVCPACAVGRLGNCELLAHGDLDAGLQSGYCCDTGGGWSTGMVAHPSQLHEVPASFDDTDAVMVEPTACAVHGALRARVEPGATVAVIGAGTLGLVTIAALARWSEPGHVVVAAKHEHQRRWARDLGAGLDDLVVCGPGELPRAVRRTVGTQVLGPPHRLTGGADVTIDCVGSAESITEAMAVTRPGGRVVLVGMPGVQRLDLTPLWQRELDVVGAYAYGTEVLAGGTSARTFDLAIELVGAAGLGRLVTATYPLERATEAVAHAAAAGRRGAVKIAFDLRDPGPARKRTSR